MTTANILCLCGGVGGAKLAYGLSRVLPADKLLIVVNTGDDFTHLGLRICPDLDSVMYALAGINDQQRGWGMAGESWQCMQMLAALRAPTWFNLGDKDLATHIQRTAALQQGLALDEVTRELSTALGIAHRIVPMSNDPVQTVVHTTAGALPFQDYFVRRGCQPVVTSISFRHSDKARPQADFARALASAAAVIICPSNPLLSIDPLLALPGVRQRLARRKVFAVSPLIQGRVVKGPAAKIMQELGLAVTHATIARHYQDIVDYLIIDEGDRDEIPAVYESGVQALALPTRMQQAEDKIRLANHIIQQMAAVV